MIVGGIPTEQSRTVTYYNGLRDSNYTLVLKGGENILTYLAKTIISVSPYDKSCPIKTLNFHGFSSVRTGDRIICEVSLFQKKRFSYYNPEDEFYFPRNPEVEEEAVQIEIVKGRRTERSVNYERFYR